MIQAFRHSLVSTLASLDFISIAAKSTLMLLLASIACWLLRHNSASIRHRIWTLGIAGSLLIPIAASVFPQLSIAILPSTPLGSLLADEPWSCDGAFRPTRRSDSCFPRRSGGYLSRTKLDAFKAADRLKQISGLSPATYPDFPLGQRLNMIAQMIKAGFETPIYYCVHGGFDTHYLQLPDHQRLLFQFSVAIKAFMNDLRESKCDDRVLVMGFSEFGRRIEENASQGTDLGTAGPVFLAGTSVKAGLIGDAPRLNDLEDGDIKMKIDFRQIYATVLDQWLNVSPADALASSFSTPMS